VKLNLNFSNSARILWAFLFAFTLSGAAVGEACTLGCAERDKEELSLLDEDDRAEGERAEEGENRGERSAETPYEGGNDGSEQGAIGQKKAQINDTRLFATASVLFSCAHAYYPHINNIAVPNEQFVIYPALSFTILYHRLVFYDRLS
jgi:hypothetical protein